MSQIYIHKQKSWMYNLRTNISINFIRKYLTVDIIKHECICFKPF